MTGQSIEDMRVEQLNAEQACDHGAMVRRCGVSRTRQVWAGWFCPEGRCKPEWVTDVRDVIGPALAAWASQGENVRPA